MFLGSSAGPRVGFDVRWRNPARAAYVRKDSWVSSGEVLLEWMTHGVPDNVQRCESFRACGVKGGFWKVNASLRGFPGANTLEHGGCGGWTRGVRTTGDADARGWTCIGARLRVTTSCELLLAARVVRPSRGVESFVEMPVKPISRKPKHLWTFGAVWTKRTGTDCGSAVMLWHRIGEVGRAKCRVSFVVEPEPAVICGPLG